MCVPISPDDEGHTAQLRTPLPSFLLAASARRALEVQSIAHRLPDQASALAEPLHLAQSILNFTSREPPETLLLSCVPRSNFSLLPLHPSSSSVLRCRHFAFDSIPLSFSFRF